MNTQTTRGIQALRSRSKTGAPKSSTGYSQALSKGEKSRKPHKNPSGKSYLAKRNNDHARTPELKDAKISGGVENNPRNVSKVQSSSQKLRNSSNKRFSKRLLERPRVRPSVNANHVLPRDHRDTKTYTELKTEGIKAGTQKKALSSVENPS